MRMRNMRSGWTWREDEFVTALVDHNLAAKALVTLATETPDPIVAHLAKSSARKSSRLIAVTVNQI